MKRYFFQLLDDNYNDIGAYLPDGSSKQSAINKARKWMQANGVRFAQLSVNSMQTENLLDIIEIYINETNR